MKESRVPLIIAVVLLLLPILYLASYFALVLPGGVVTVTRFAEHGAYMKEVHAQYYRVGETSCRWFYWPLEVIDRKLRPAEWDPYVKADRVTA